MDDLTDDELWRSVEHTVRTILLPALDPDDQWAQSAAIQLVGLARFARTRSGAVDDPTELIATLHRLSANPIVNAHWRSIRNAADLDVTVGAILAGAVDDDTEAGDQIRREVRPLVVARLDADLATTQGLLPHFRGQLDP
jgi:hypothetical protein